MSRPFPTSASLTAIAIAYRNPAVAYIADGLFPRNPVGAERFSYTTYPIGTFFSLPDTQVGRRGRVARVEFSGNEVTDAVNDYGLEDVIPQTDINEAAAMRAQGMGTFDPEETATEGMADLMLIDREIRVATLAQNPNAYAPANRLALSGGDQFSDYTNSKPIDVIKAAMSAVLVFRPNVMSMSQSVFDMLSSHPHLVNAIRGNISSRGIVTAEEIAKLFSLDKVLVGRGYANTARRGQTAAIQRIWGKHIVLAYVDPSPNGLRSGMTFGVTATYGGKIAGSWEDRNIGLLGGKVVRVGERMKELVTAPDVGFLLQNVVA